MSRTCFYFSLVFVFSLLWKHSGPSYVSPETQKRMKLKIFHMEMELVKDVIMKNKAVEPYKDMYIKSVVYNVGQLMHYVRMKMKRLNVLYLNKYSEVAQLNNANDKTLYKKKWDIKKSMGDLLEVEKIVMELDVVIDAMEKFEIENEDKYAIHERMKYLRSGRKYQVDESLLKQLVFHSRLENKLGTRKGTKKNQTRKWHYGGDGGISSVMKNLKKSAFKNNQDYLTT